MSEWTKGPWAWTDPNGIASGLSGVDGKPVIDDLGYDGLYINPKSADAALIAAAPTMAEALGDARRAIASLDEYALGGGEVIDTSTGESIGQYPIRDELLAKIDAALSLAKGEDRNG
jgi:hypothetical protein